MLGGIGPYSAGRAGLGGVKAVDGFRTAPLSFKAAIEVIQLVSLAAFVHGVGGIGLAVCDLSQASLDRYRVISRELVLKPLSIHTFGVSDRLAKAVFFESSYSPCPHS